MALLSRLLDGPSHRSGHTFIVESFHFRSQAFFSLLNGKPSFETSLLQSLAEGLSDDIIARIMKRV